MTSRRYSPRPTRTIRPISRWCSTASIDYFSRLRCRHGRSLTRSSHLARLPSSTTPATLSISTARQVKLLGWQDGKPPADPVGGSFGRNSDGTSDGTAFESGALMMVIGELLPKAIPHPLHSGALFYKLMAQCGITSTSEHTYNSRQYPAYAALAAVPDCPLRLHLYHMSIESDVADDVVFPIPHWCGRWVSSSGQMDRRGSATSRPPLSTWTIPQPEPRRSNSGPGAKRR